MRRRNNGQYKHKFTWVSLFEIETSEPLRSFIANTKDNCFYCKRNYSEHNLKISKDHFYPREMFGNNNMANLVFCCRECNELKGDIDPSLFWDFAVKHLWKREYVLADVKLELRNYMINKEWYFLQPPIFGIDPKLKSAKEFDYTINGTKHLPCNFFNLMKDAWCDIVQQVDFREFSLDK